MENQWINVSDRMPEPFKPVLAFQQNKHLQFRQIIVGFDGQEWREFDVNETSDDLFNEGRYRKITHWMPLPIEPNL